MKKLFEINDSERQRILEMHTTATKNVYLISESQINETDPPATSLDTGIDKSTKSGKVNLKDVLKLNNKFYFNTGKTGLNKDSIRNYQELQTFLNNAKNYLRKINKPFEIFWTSSESQTPKKGTSVNSLSQKRGEVIGDYFESQLGDLPAWKTTEYKTVSGNYKQGLIPYKQGVDDPNDPKYLNDQWVEVNIVTK
jgi:hypothetical protein